MEETQQAFLYDYKLQILKPYEDYYIKRSSYSESFTFNLILLCALMSIVMFNFVLYIIWNVNNDIKNRLTVSSATTYICSIIRTYGNTSAPNPPI